MRSPLAAPLPRAWLTSLAAGDLTALVLVTLAGFATHDTLGTAGTRMLTTLLPAAVGWAAAAPWLGLYQPTVVSDARQLWRPAAACLLAGPLAAVLRGLWLNTPILPIFALVLTSSAALALTAWRSLWWFLTERQARRG